MGCVIIWLNQKYEVERIDENSKGKHGGDSNKHVWVLIFSFSLLITNIVSTT